MPVAVEAGISEKVFLSMTLREVRMHIAAYWKQKKNEWEKSEYQAWLTAYYTVYSIGVNLSKKVKFPNNPLNEENAIMDVSEMDKDEIANVHADFLEKLDLMARVSMGK